MIVSAFCTCICKDDEFSAQKLEPHKLFIMNSERHPKPTYGSEQKILAADICWVPSTLNLLHKHSLY